MKKKGEIRMNYGLEQKKINKELRNIREDKSNSFEEILKRKENGN